MKVFKTIIIILILALVGVSVWNKIQFEKCKRLVEFKNAQNTKMQQENETVENAVIKSQTVSMIHLDKKLILHGIERLFPKDGKMISTPVEHPRLILIFSELSCNVCQDKETQFAVDIAGEFGQDYVMAIVHAVNKRYVQNYIRMNQVNFPVYYCDDKNKAFFKDNEIVNTPVLFVIDNTNRIIASHIPIPGQLQYSEPIHQFCYHYFNQKAGGARSP
jgi:hypothetical protein